MATGTIMLVLTVAAAAMSAAAAAKQAQAQAASQRFRAAADRQRAERQRKVAKVQADAQRRTGSRTISKLRARSSGRGLTGLGSPLLVQQDAAAETELTALTTLATGLTGAAGLDINASLLRFNAAQGEQVAALQIGSTLLSGFSKAAGGFGPSPSANQTGGALQDTTQNSIKSFPG